MSCPHEDEDDPWAEIYKDLDRAFAWFLFSPFIGLGLLLLILLLLHLFS